MKFMCWVRSGCPGGPDLEKIDPEGLVPEGWGARRVGPPVPPDRPPPDTPPQSNVLGGGPPPPLIFVRAGASSPELTFVGRGGGGEALQITKTPLPPKARP